MFGLADELSDKIEALKDYVDKLEDEILEKDVQIQTFKNVCKRQSTKIADYRFEYEHLRGSSIDQIKELKFKLKEIKRIVAG